jgi:hypothetical protein
MESGRRIQVSLRTSDYSEAVLNATKIIEQPFLNESEPLLEQEIDSFLRHKNRQNEYWQFPPSNRSGSWTVAYPGSFFPLSDLQL